MLDDLLHREAVTTVVNDPRQLLHHLGHQIRPEVGAWKLGTIEILLLEERVQSEHLFDEARDLGILDHRPVVPLDCSNRNCVTQRW